MIFQTNQHKNNENKTAQLGKSKEVKTNASARNISRHMAPVDAHNSAIPGAILPKIGEDLSKMWPNRHAKLKPIDKAPAEKSVTVQKKAQ